MLSNVEFLESSTHLQGPKTLAYNPAESAVLITSDVDGGSYELYLVPKESARGDTAPVSMAIV